MNVPLFWVKGEGCKSKNHIYIYIYPFHSFFYKPPNTLEKVRHISNPLFFILLLFINFIPFHSIIIIIFLKTPKHSTKCFLLLYSIGIDGCIFILANSSRWPFQPYKDTIWNQYWASWSFSFGILYYLLYTLKKVATLCFAILSITSH